MKKRMLMTDCPWSYDDEDIREAYIEAYEDEDPTDTELTQFLYDEIDLERECFIDQVRWMAKKAGRILAIGDAGLWDGRHRWISDEDDLNGIFKYCEDYNTFSLDHDLKLSAMHHDGTNYVTFRELKPGLSDRQLENLENKVWNGGLSKRDITRYTRSLRPIFRDYYGF